MNNLSTQQYSPAKQLLLSLLIVIVSFLICMFAGSILTALSFDINLMTDASALDAKSSNANISALKFFQIIYSLGLFIFPPFIIAYFIHGKIFSYLYLDKIPKSILVILAVCITFFALPIIGVLGEWNAQMHLPDFLSGLEAWMKQSEEQAKIITEKFLEMHSVSDLWINLFVIAVIPALGEELLFRGVIQQIFIRMTNNKHWAIFISAFIFSALHLQFFGFLPRMLMGVLFGYLLVWSGSLWIPIIAHLTNNGMAVIITYMISKGNISKEVENIGTNGDIAVNIISVLLVALLLFLFARISKR